MKLRANVTIVGIGQGAVSKKDAFPKQMLAAKLAHESSAKQMMVVRTVDNDGERGVMIAPALPKHMAAALGRRFGQRSVISGPAEVRSEDGKILMRFESEGNLSSAKPGGFFTHIPSLGVYFSLVPVKAHKRNGRPVVGYSTRRKRRAR